MPSACLALGRLQLQVEKKKKKTEEKKHSGAAEASGWVAVHV